MSISAQPHTTHSNLTASHHIDAQLQGGALLLHAFPSDAVNDLTCFEYGHLTSHASHPSMLHCYSLLTTELEWLRRFILLQLIWRWRTLI